jgi:hypothetical protein
VIFKRSDKMEYYANNNNDTKTSHQIRVKEIAQMALQYRPQAREVFVHETCASDGVTAQAVLKHLGEWEQAHTLRDARYLYHNNLRFYIEKALTFNVLGSVLGSVLTVGVLKNSSTLGSVQLIMGVMPIILSLGLTKLNAALFIAELENEGTEKSTKNVPSNWQGIRDKWASVPTTAALGVQHLKPLSGYLKMASYFMAFATVCTYFATDYAYGWVANESLGNLGTVGSVARIGLVGLLSGVVVSLTYPFYGIATALLKFKSQGYEYDINCAENQGRNFATKNRLSRLAMAMGLVLAVLMMGASYFCLVPPAVETATVSAPMSRPPVTTTVNNNNPTFSRLADSENAWTDYNRAILRLADLSNLSFTESNINKPFDELVTSRILALAQDTGYRSLVDSIEKNLPLTPEGEAFLAKNQAVFSDLQAGAAKSHAQFIQELPTFSTRVPNLLSTRALIISSVAESRRLFHAGEVKAAVKLNLDAYKFATDIAEPHGSLIFTLISIVGRDQATKGLQYLLDHAEQLATGDLQTIAQTLAKDNARMVTPQQSMTEELDVMQRSLTGILLQDQPFHEADINASMFKILKSLPGFRVRAYNYYLVEERQAREFVNKEVASWDFAAMSSRQEALTHGASWYASPGKALLSVGLPNAAALAKSAYLDQVRNQAVQIQAALLAYHQVNGQYPTTLAPAMAVVNVSVPVDLATNKAVSYRLENNQPLFWFAGIDRQDNGGQGTSLTLEEMHQLKVTGKDIIFQLGESPFDAKNRK